MGEITNSASLILRSGSAHLRYYSPEAKGMDPPQYAGKIETVGATMGLDLLGVNIKSLPDPYEFARCFAGLGLVCRAYDEVVDNLMPYTDEPITPYALNNTLFLHKYVGKTGRFVRGNEGRTIILESAAKLIPGNSTGSKRRRNDIEDLLDAYSGMLANTANNPAYHEGEILPFSVAMHSRRDVTARLGETTIAMTAVLLDMPSKELEAKLFGQMAMAMQFGDDLFDWQKDWAKHRARSHRSPRPLRPQDNLFNSTLLEYKEEKTLCENALNDSSKKSIDLAREHAPITTVEFNQRFSDVLRQFPPHEYRSTARNILNFVFFKILPKAPASGRFYNWAKY